MAFIQDIEKINDIIKEGLISVLSMYVGDKWNEGYLKYLNTLEMFQLKIILEDEMMNYFIKEKIVEVKIPHFKEEIEDENTK